MHSTTQQTPEARANLIDPPARNNRRDTVHHRIPFSRTLHREDISRWVPASVRRSSAVSKVGEFLRRFSRSEYQAIEGDDNEEPGRREEPREPVELQELVEPRATAESESEGSSESELEPHVGHFQSVDPFDNANAITDEAGPSQSPPLTSSSLEVRGRSTSHSRRDASISITPPPRYSPPRSSPPRNRRRVVRRSTTIPDPPAGSSIPRRLNEKDELFREAFSVAQRLNSEFLPATAESTPQGAEGSTQETPAQIRARLVECIRKYWEKRECMSYIKRELFGFIEALQGGEDILGNLDTTLLKRQPGDMYGTVEGRIQSRKHFAEAVMAYAVVEFRVELGIPL